MCLTEFHVVSITTKAHFSRPSQIGALSISGQLTQQVPNECMAHIATLEIQLVLCSIVILGEYLSFMMA